MYVNEIWCGRMPDGPPTIPGESSPKIAQTAFAVLTFATTAAPASVLHTVLATDGVTIPEALLLPLYTVLILWVGTNFWLSAFGAARLICKTRDRRDREPETGDICAGGQPRAAIVMMLCDEEPVSVFARLRAMYRSLDEQEQIGGFEFFVLSDTRNPNIWLAEELAWLEACRDLGADGHLFYRRRARNDERKVGNIKDFLERWGYRYEYMIVLDADSVMDARTLIEIVRRMDEEPDLGLLQVWPRPVCGETLFARLQQFAASTYGRLTAHGMAWLLGNAGNYWGHNAIIRTTAFIESCGLPKLPGKAPMGGDILSHDFVEAALLCRAGWKVRLVDDLEGSYEQGPPDFIEHARRDRRWCQGNLQHAKLLLVEGLKLSSRVNFMVGLMAYVAAPLWLLFLAFGVLVVEQSGFSGSIGLSALSNEAVSSPLSRDAALAGLLTVTLGLLLGPKLMGLTMLLISRRRRRSHNGGLATTVSVLLETVIAALLAPILMMLHTQFVATILAGQSVRWDPQRRDARDITWRETARAYKGVMLSGVALVFFVAVTAPVAVVWLLPVLAGLLAGAPLTVATGRASFGAVSRRAGLFITPEEVAPPEILTRVTGEQQLSRRYDTHELYRRLLENPQFNAVHCAMLPRNSADPANEALRRLVLIGPDAMSAAEKTRALSDIAGLRQLHAILWTLRVLQDDRFTLKLPIATGIKTEL